MLWQLTARTFCWQWPAAAPPTAQAVTVTVAVQQFAKVRPLFHKSFQSSQAIDPPSLECTLRRVLAPVLRHTKQKPSTVAFGGGPPYSCASHELLGMDDATTAVPVIVPVCCQHRMRTAQQIHAVNPLQSAEGSHHLLFHHCHNTNTYACMHSRPQDSKAASCCVAQHDLSQVATRVLATPPGCQHADKQTDRRSVGRQAGR